MRKSPVQDGVKMNSNIILQKLDNVKRIRPGEWMANCPAHKDTKPSLSIKDVGDKVLLKCHANCKTEDVVRALGLTMKDLFLDAGRAGKGFLNTYDYTDEQGTLLFQVCRKKPKGFVQRQPGEGSSWTYNLKGVRRVLYRLPELMGADVTQPVFVTEGEKDVDRLWKGGLVATTNSGGAGNWREEYDEFLRGKDVVILPDNDVAGRDHARSVAASLQGVARSIKILALAGLSEGGDVSDWLDQGHSIDELRELAAREEAEAKTEDEFCDGAPLLAYETDILSNLDGLLDELGLAGERRNAKLLYLALTSRLTDRPASIWVTGPSSSGKSWLVDTVLKAFPESAYFARSSMSERALIYTDESFSHRYMVLYELAGLNHDFADYILRSLLSEGKIKYETVETVSGRQKSRFIEKEGPTGLILTTTKKTLHPENATRMWCIAVEASSEQTRAVLMAEARSCSGALSDGPDRNAWNEHGQVETNGVVQYCAQIEGRGARTHSREDWIQLQRWIEGTETRVEIPFVWWLAEHTDDGGPRLRRDFHAVLNLIKAHAILHQESRERNGDGEIIATPDDYRVVHGLVSDIVGKSNRDAVPVRVRRVVLAVQKLEGEGTVSYKQLVEEIGIDKSNISRHVQEAIELGYLENEEKGSGKPARIGSIRELPDEGILPSPSALDCEWEVLPPLEMLATAQCLC